MALKREQNGIILFLLGWIVGFRHKGRFHSNV